jgi:hypothetical protein
MQGTHPFGGVICELAGSVHDFIQLQVEVPEVGAHDVPVGLLALKVEFDQVRQDGLEVVGQGR